MIIVNANSKMQKVMREANMNNYQQYFERKYLEHKRLITTNNYVVFAGEYSDKFIDIWKDDFTGLEGNVNDFHVNHQASDQNITTSEEPMNQGITNGLFQKSILACEEIFSLINNCDEIRSNDVFTISFSIDSYNRETDSNNKDILECDSSLRFTKKREESSWLDSDLEVYQQPVMTIDFDKQSVQNIPEKWWQS